MVEHSSNFYQVKLAEVQTGHILYSVLGTPSQNKFKTTGAYPQILQWKYALDTKAILDI